MSAKSHTKASRCAEQPINTAPTGASKEHTADVETTGTNHTYPRDDMNTPQLRMLNFISALELKLDDMMQLTVELGKLTEWVHNNPDLDIADHPRYVELVGPACETCRGGLEKRTNGLWCAVCERMHTGDRF